MSLLEQEIARLVGLSAPILCLDTCSLLDVMRDPTRDNVYAHEAKLALRLLELVETKLDLVALIAEQVRLEFDEHADAIEQETVQALEKLQHRVERIDAIASAFGGIGKTDLSYLNSHASRARAVANRWIAGATMAPQSPDIPVKALARVNQARTPARKGKDSIKDCVVIETYLDFVGKLRNAGLTTRIVFASSNTKDYRGEPGPHLKADLAAEFAGLNMEYAPNLGAAARLLGF